MEKQFLCPTCQVDLKQQLVSLSENQREINFAICCQICSTSSPLKSSNLIFRIKFEIILILFLKQREIDRALNWNGLPLFIYFSYLSNPLSPSNRLNKMPKQIKTMSIDISS